MIDREAVAAVLAHLNGRLRAAGMEHLVINLDDDGERRSEPLERILLRALADLERDLHVRGAHAHERLLRRLREVASTEEGEPVAGVDVALTPTEQQAYGVGPRVPLDGAEEYDILADQVGQLRRELTNELGGTEWR
jgi:hypothetical protein